MNKIVIELCAEDRQRIDELIAFAGCIAGEMKSAAPGPVLMDGTAFRAAAVDHPADAPTTHFEPVVAAPAASAPDPAAVEPAPAVKPISLGEFQKAIVTRCAESPATKAKVQALVHKYADSVSNIPEGKRSEVLAALAEL